MQKKHSTVSIGATILLLSMLLACSSLSLPFGLQTPTPTNTSTPTATTTFTPSPTITSSPTPNQNLKIVSSLPMTGASLNLTLAIVNAEMLRLREANYSACGGRYVLTYKAWDDASAALGKWDPAVEVENANNAAADPSIIAYLGTFNSGAAKLSIPILNQAGPLVMISPANTNPALTKPGKGQADEPDKYYPSGIRNYARVSMADDVQGDVLARFVKNSLGVKTVYILDDNELYGYVIARNFETTAEEIGLIIVGHESIDPRATNYTSLMKRISSSNGGKPPDAIFAGIVVDNNAPQLLKDKVAVLGDNKKVKFIGPDGIQTQYLIDSAGRNIAEGVYAAIPGLSLDSLPELGQQFIINYNAEYGGHLVEPYAAYGYETMNVLINAIENVCASGGDPADRRQVCDAVFSTKDFEGVLGTWSFDENGDTTLMDMTVYQVKGGEYVPVGVYK